MTPAMAALGRVRYLRSAPESPELSRGSEATFLAPVRLRPLASRVTLKAAQHPGLVAQALWHGASMRDVLRFLAWHDTARCFGVTDLERTDVAASVFARHLPHGTEPSSRPDRRVSGVVIARDEAVLLPHALRSLAAGTDELVVVVDDRTTDETAAVAEEYGARVATRAFAGDFAAQRNLGLAHVTTPWALCIDADEIVEQSLWPWLRHAMDYGPDAIAVMVNSTVEGSDELRGWPDIQVRLFRAHLRYRGALHELVEGWRSLVQLPLSAPGITHHKTLRRQLEADLRYFEMDPTPYGEGYDVTLRARLAELDGDVADDN